VEPCEGGDEERACGGDQRGDTYSPRAIVQGSGEGLHGRLKAQRFG
jgi:hypothetical protein